ncbi:MAG: hypothetical protein EOM50_04360 [Erysipelotrichia bacterium]|nr:hypothetical protein [Erysipelotrichia bacterium]NCC54454.1 hypothetical protein [Erysipelotrichia bacterium]
MNLKKNKKQWKGSKAAIAFYVLAFIFLLYGAYMIYTVYEYLVSYYASYSAGMWDDVKSTIQYFVSNCSSYFVYAIICYGLGMIINMLHSIKTTFVNEKAMEEEKEVLSDDASIEYHGEEKIA